MTEEKDRRTARRSNHSIDRFLLVTVLGWFYRDSYLYIGSEQKFKQWKNKWTGEQQLLWSDRSIIQAMKLEQAMNVCLKERDAALLKQSLTYGSGEDLEEKTGREERPEEDWYRTLKRLMMLQYSGKQEQQALQEQMKASVKEVVIEGKKRKYEKEVGIQRKTVDSLLQELVMLEDRLQAMEDQKLADWLAARVQGFRLVRCDEKEPIYHIAGVGQPEQQMAAVQAAYYPFLDKKHTDQILDLLGLTSERRYAMDSVSEEKWDCPQGGELPEQLEQALTAVERAWQVYAEDTDEVDLKKMFWYELDYHRWQWHNGQLTLCKTHRIPLLPWKVVYSNGYFYLCGFRLDLSPQVTGGAQGQNPVLSNLRLDRVRNLQPVRLDESQCDITYRPTEIQDILERVYRARSRAGMEYRDGSTIMYSGTPESLLIDCDASLMNSAVDDFGPKNITLEQNLPGNRVRIRVREAVWDGAKQWLLQHAGACYLTKCEAQAEKRQQMAALLQAAADDYKA